MEGENKGRKSGRDSIDKIDGLIEIGYDSLLEKVREQGLTIGEFLKMIDMRMKVTTKEPGNKEFWDMLDKIRRARLGNDKPKILTGCKKTTKVRKEKAV